MFCKTKWLHTSWRFLREGVCMCGWKHGEVSWPEEKKNGITRNQKGQRGGRREKEAGGHWIQPPLAQVTEERKTTERSFIILPLHFKHMVIVGLANKLGLNYRPLGTINKENQFHKNLSLLLRVSFPGKRVSGAWSLVLQILEQWNEAPF